MEGLWDYISFKAVSACFWLPYKVFALLEVLKLKEIALETLFSSLKSALLQLIISGNERQLVRVSKSECYF